MNPRFTIPLLLGAVCTPALAQEPLEYTFQNSGPAMAGVKSMAELRGRPVLIEFWGTR